MNGTSSLCRHVANRALQLMYSICISCRCMSCLRYERGYHYYLFLIYAFVICLNMSKMRWVYCRPLLFSLHTPENPCIVLPVSTCLFSCQVGLGMQIRFVKTKQCCGGRKGLKKSELINRLLAPNHGDKLLATSIPIS